MTDPTRQPAGAETAWAYTHVPRQIHHDAGGEVSGRWDADDEAAMVERIEQRVEDLAPGFRSRILGRHVFTPGTFPLADANLDGGAINGGTSQLHQQLFFRPTPGLGTTRDLRRRVVPGLGQRPPRRRRSRRLRLQHGAAPRWPRRGGSASTAGFARAGGLRRRGAEAFRRANNGKTRPTDRPVIGAGGGLSPLISRDGDARCTRTVTAGDIHRCRADANSIWGDFGGATPTTPPRL